MPSGGNQGVDEDLLKRMSDMEQNLSMMTNSLNHLIKQTLPEELSLKADKHDLEELENKILVRLNDIIGALTSKFADKAETKKALKLLER